MAQGDDNKKIPGTCFIFVMTHNEIRNIPQDRVVTYARLVVYFRPQKDDPNRVIITAGGNLIKYPGDLTTRTADMTTVKILCNSILSTEGARFVGLNIKKLLSWHPTRPFRIHEDTNYPFPCTCPAIISTTWRPCKKWIHLLGD